MSSCGQRYKVDYAVDQSTKQSFIQAIYEIKDAAGNLLHPPITHLPGSASFAAAVANATDCCGSVQVDIEKDPYCYRLADSCQEVVRVCVTKVDTDTLEIVQPSGLNVFWTDLDGNTIDVTDPSGQLTAGSCSDGAGFTLDACGLL